jgi:hypothetical protein
MSTSQWGNGVTSQRVSEVTSASLMRYSLPHHLVARYPHGKCVAQLDNFVTFPYTIAGVGAVAQMGERINRTDEVRGSSPLSSI